MITFMTVRWIYIAIKTIHYAIATALLLLFHLPFAQIFLFSKKLTAKCLLVSSFAVSLKFLLQEIFTHGPPDLSMF